MIDYVRKIVPYHGVETDAIEGWLEEKAAEGLVLERMHGILAKFRKTKRCRLRYRIDTTSSGMDTISEKKAQKLRARIKQLSECGWQYIPGLTGRISIYKTEDLSQTELPPNPDGVAPPRASWWVGGLSGMIGAYAAQIWPLWHSDFEYRLTEGFHDLLQLVILVIACIVAICVERFALRKLKKRKAEGDFPNRGYHTAERARRGKVVKVLYVGFLALVLLGSLLSWGNLMTHNYNSLTDYDEPIPFPILVEINEEEGELVTQHAKDPQDTDAFICLTKQEALLVPKRLTLYQDWWPAQQDPSSVQYRVNYYELCTEKLARPLLTDLRERSDEGVYQRIPASEGVQAFYYANGESQSLLLQYKKLLVETYYSGKTNLRDCLPLFERYLVGEGRQGELATPE